MEFRIIILEKILKTLDKNDTQTISRFMRGMSVKKGCIMERRSKRFWIQLMLINIGIILNLTVNSQTNGFITYTNSDYSFSIQYPGDWERNYNLASNCVFMTQDPKIYYNINVVITSNFGGTVDDITMDKMNLKARQSSTNIRFISERSILINGERGKEFVCVFSINGYNLKNLVYEFLKGGILYTITITGLEENFERTKSNSLSMINSFKLF